MARARSRPRRTQAPDPSRPLPVPASGIGAAGTMQRGGPPGTPPARAGGPDQPGSASTFSVSPAIDTGEVWGA